MVTLINHSSNTKELILIFIIFLLPLGCKQKDETKLSEEVTTETQSSQTKDENTVPPEMVSPEKKVVAKVNGRPIYQEDIKVRKLEYAIVDEILFEEGLRRGLDKGINDQINNKYKKYLIVNAIKLEIQKNLPKGQEPTDKEIEDFYKKYESKYTYLTAIGISVRDKNIAKKIRKKAVKGQNFEKIASDYSDSGVIVSPKDINLTIDKNNYFRELRVGSISDIVEVNGSYVIYKTIKVRKIPLSKVKTAISYSVIAMKLSQAYSDFAEKVKKENNIKVAIIQEEK